MTYTPLEIIAFVLLVIVTALFVRWMIRYDAKEDEMNARTRYEQSHKAARRMREQDSNDHVDRSFLG